MNKFSKFLTCLCTRYMSCPSCLDLIILTEFGIKKKLWSFSFCYFLNAMFLHVLNLCTFLNVRHPVLHLHKVAGKMICNRHCNESKDSNELTKMTRSRNWNKVLKIKIWVYQEEWYLTWYFNCLPRMHDSS
jgi:hypothetical protein